MLNISNNDAEVVFKLKKDSAKTSPFFISNSTKVHFNLKTKKPHNLATMSFGLGKWTKASIKNIADDLELVEIKHAKDSLLFNTEDQIEGYLFAKRKGTFKSRIEIIIY
jgi:tRNA U34 2-thiouridine synthase MnmA/TrmU